MDRIYKCEEYLLDIPKFKKKTLISDTVKFYEMLNSPGKDIPRIHVAGTNGKGSTCFYTSQILKAHGLRVGLFTSPHLVSMKERFVINGEMITDDEFIQVFNQVKDRCEAFDDEEKQVMHPSFFEFLFLMFMLWVDMKKPDVIVLETGLGGTLDATNIFETDSVAVICSIGMDHVEQLGNDIKQIASQKAGIIKDNMPVVYLNNSKEANEVIEKVAASKQAKIYSLSDKNISDIRVSDKHVDFCLNFGYDNSVCVKDLDLSLDTCGLYQRLNASMAILTAKVYLKESFDENKAKMACNKGSFSGRMEEIHPGFYVDGAHNEDAVIKLLETLEKVDAKKSLIFGACKDKDYKTMLDMIIESNVFKNIIFTKVNSPRAAKVNELMEVVGNKGETDINITSADNVGEAIEMLVCEEGVKYIAGSLYLVGEAIDYLRRRTDD